MHLSANLKRDVTPMLLQGELTLTKLWFYIQPTQRSMLILEQISNAVNKVTTPTI